MLTVSHWSRSENRKGRENGQFRALNLTARIGDLSSGFRVVVHPCGRVIDGVSCSHCHLGYLDHEMSERWATGRARVEVPYREHRRPTRDDYMAMIEATGKMKRILEELAAEVSTAARQATVSFLDRLAAEARWRLRKMSEGPSS